MLGTDLLRYNENGPCTVCEPIHRLIRAGKTKQICDTTTCDCHIRLEKAAKEKAKLEKIEQAKIKKTKTKSKTKSKKA